MGAVRVTPSCIGRACHGTTAQSLTAGSHASAMMTRCHKWRQREQHIRAPRCRGYCVNREQETADDVRRCAAVGRRRLQCCSHRRACLSAAVSFCRLGFFLLLCFLLLVRGRQHGRLDLRAGAARACACSCVRPGPAACLQRAQLRRLAGSTHDGEVAARLLRLAGYVGLVVGVDHLGQVLRAGRRRTRQRACSGAALHANLQRCTARAHLFILVLIEQGRLLWLDVKLAWHSSSSVASAASAGGCTATARAHPSSSWAFCHAGCRPAWQSSWPP